MSEKSKEDKNGHVTTTFLPPDVKKAGILRKLKTMKKKYFVLRTESENGPARLEYYDSEKKYRSGAAPKRSISIKKCFNINRKVDAKQKLAIALYTKDDCFSVVTENEQSLDEWLKAMLELQLDATSVNGGAMLKPKFEHVWQVSVGEKSLACSRNMKGLYRLCLTNTSLTLVKMEQSDNPESLEFPLMSIRRCGHSNNYFFFELGRSSITGAGELWLETEDVVIAQNMHEVTLNAMKTCREHEDMGPHRPRSSSNSETSRPIATRRPVAVVNAQPNAYPSVRNRCDSMPSRPRTISEGQEISNRGYSNHHLDSLRSHIGYSQSASYSPPGNPLSPSSTGCSTDSAGSSLSIEEHDGIPADFTHIRYSHSVPIDSVVPTEPPIKEEQMDAYMSMSLNIESSTERGGYMHMGPVHSSSAPAEKSLYLNLNLLENMHLNSTSSSLKGSDYVDMTSPISLPGDYIPMSPIGSEVAKTNLEAAQNSWSSSKVTDGYLYMGPTSSCTTSHTEGYLDMAPLSSSLPKAPSALSGNIDFFNLKGGSCGTSEASIASSPDVAKTEVYQLDKVKSLLAQTDDTSEDYIRPVRAYSMGSRPQVKKTHLSVHNEGSRIRAYSVGSQAATARNKVLNSADQDLGSMKGINVRAGAKSSSAPLLHNRPPRMRPSGSRGDIGEDLMEIDYNKTRCYTTSFHEKDFTIEPVGRSRSGSCSSSSTTAVLFSEKADRRNKVLYDQDKAGLHSVGKNITNNSDSLKNYLSMSPSVCSANSASRINANTQVKLVEHVHPSGDYVSLNPLVKYSSLNSIKTVPGPSISNYGDSRHSVVETTASTIPDWKPNICCDNASASMVSKEINASDKTECSPCDKICNKDDILSQIKSPKTSKGETSVVDTSGYMCMNFKKTVSDETPTENYISSSCSEIESNQEKLTKEVETVISDTTALGQIHSPTKISNLLNSRDVLSQNRENTVPKTPPPSPRSGAGSCTTINSTDPLLTSLQKHLLKATTQSAPNSRPTSTCEDLWLNYASLDLPSSAEDDITIMPVHRVRQITNLETKKVPLTYAEIDFSSPKPNPVPDSLKEGMSHL